MNVINEKKYMAIMSLLLVALLAVYFVTNYAQVMDGSISQPDIPIMQTMQSTDEKERADFVNKYSGTPTFALVDLDVENTLTWEPNGDLFLNGVLIKEDDDILSREFFKQMEPLINEHKALGRMIEEDVANAEAGARESKEAIKDLAKRGYFREEDKEQYHQYDAETLSAMGEDGDLKALIVLAEKPIAPQRKAWANMRASMLGSTNAMNGLAISEHPYESKDKASPEHKNALWKSLAWYKLSKRMGDKYAADKLADMAESLTSVDQEVINNIADTYLEIVNNNLKEQGREPLAME